MSVLRGLAIALALACSACTYSSEVAPHSGPADTGVPVEWIINTSCGLDRAVFDLDGSIWTPSNIGPGDREGTAVGDDNDIGTLTLISEVRAEYRTSQGRVIQLRRLPGDLVRNDC
jgi:hypothetical protein